jgi:nuclear pore complex protein Nup98-Nup96
VYTNASTFAFFSSEILGGFGSTPSASVTPFGSSTVTMGTGNPKYSNFQERDSVSGLMNTFHSIGAMPAYSKKSNEELRWEDYQQNRKGAVGFGLSTPTVFGSGSPSTSVPTSLFGQPAPSSVGFGSGPFGGAQPAAPSSFGGFASSSTIAPSSAVAATPPLFGATPGASGGAAPSFGAGPTTSLFGTPSAGSLFGSTSGAAPQAASFGMAGPSSTVSTMTPAFAQAASPFGQKPAGIASFFGTLL